MKQPIYYIYNQGRRKKFAIETSIFIEKGEKKVVKTALYPDGNQHIENMVATYNKLSSLPDLKKHISVLPINLLGASSVGFDFIKGKSAERLLVEQIMSGDEDGMLSLMSKFNDIIQALPTIKINPTQSDEFVAIFGKNYDKICDCANPGIIDFNFDNFIVDKNSTWNLFDYEWCFEFAIPKEYLIQRFLFWFFVMRYSNLSLLCGNKIGIVEIGKNIYIPKIIYDSYKNSFDSMQQLIEAEWNLHNFIQVSPPLIDENGFKLGVSLHGKVRILSQTDLDNKIESQSLLRRYEIIEASLNLIVSQHDLLNQELANTKQELTDIIQSKSYRYANKLRHLKNIISLKR